MDDSLRQDLIKRLKQVGAYDVRVADPNPSSTAAKIILCYYK
jgi:hypothetical protein